MYEPKLEKDIRCPLEYGLDVFGGKWKSRIICVLAEKQVLRYSSLRKEMTNISDAVLAATLKELIADGIIKRQQYDEIPPKVEYFLTEKGYRSSRFCRVSAAGRELIIKKKVRIHFYSVRSVIIMGDRWEPEKYIVIQNGKQIE